MPKIPDMTDPLGQYWEQPSKENILLDETQSVMSERDFAQLYEYSTSIPAGKYVGKMWRAELSGKWFLLWYDLDADPNYLSIPHREIILIGE